VGETGATAWVPFAGVHARLANLGTWNAGDLSSSAPLACAQTATSSPSRTKPPMVVGSRYASSSAPASSIIGMEEARGISADGNALVGIASAAPVTKWCSTARPAQPWRVRGGQRRVCRAPSARTAPRDQTSAAAATVVLFACARTTPTSTAASSWAGWRPPLGRQIAT
jgi:hypothetical protein